MSKNKIVSVSKKLSLVLRHNPQKIGIVLDNEGWTSVEALLVSFSKSFSPLSMELLQEVVDQNDKKRFAFNTDKSKIRASQGHSIKVDLAYTPQKPLEILFHGTATRFVDSIKTSGLIPNGRTHVHLSDNTTTAQQVGSRHGKPIILNVLALSMHEDGYEFFLSDNGVWLTKEVPVQYIDFKENDSIGT